MQKQEERENDQTHCGGGGSGNTKCESKGGTEEVRG